MRRTPQSDDLSSLGEIRLREPGISESKLLQQFHELRRVLRCRLNQNIQVPSIAGAAMEGEAMRPDDDVVNAARV